MECAQDVSSMPVPATVKFRPTIVIDARVTRSNAGHGIARYVFELICHLMLHPASFRYVLLVNSDSPFLKMPLPDNFSVVPMRSGWMSIWGTVELAFLLRKIRPNLFHSPSFMVPFLISVPLVSTIHDLNHVVLAHNYSWAHKFYYNYLLPRKMRRAKKVITVSLFSKNEILNFFKIPETRVRVIYNGVGHNYSPIDKQDVNKLREFREKYELPETYILTIGNRKPHKNIARLVEAYCKGGFSLPLVLRSDFDPALLAIAERYNKKHAIHFVRFVSHEELPYLFCLASVFVFPSLYEGFGLPPVEAAACGVPVVVSDRSSLPEVMRNSAYYVDPENTDDIRRGIEEALTSGKGRMEKIRNGLSLASIYNWERAAEETLTLYNELLLPQIAMREA